MGWFGKRREAAEHTVESEVTKLETRAGALEARAKAYEAEQEKAVIKMEARLETQLRALANGTLRCEKCGSHVAQVQINQMANGQIFCSTCLSQARRQTPGEVLRNVLADLDFVEKGPPTEEDLDYVRRSLLEGP